MRSAPDTPAPTIEEPPPGVSARELIWRQRGRYSTTLGAAALERWLIDKQLAETSGVPGRLVPTPLGRWLGGCLGSLGYG